MTFISKEIIDEIKAHNDIADVIGSYIELNDKNKALCPFHNDHHESLSVSKDKQIFRCFSCGASGNVVKFVERIESCTYPEALQKLADRVGIEVNINSPKKINLDFKKIYDINYTVNNYFKNNLLSSQGKTAMKYLTERGIVKDLINTFNIGLALGNNNLSKTLTSKYSESDLLDADVIKIFDDKIYDSFQNRIIFPILDESDNVIAFSGRKYLPKDKNDDEVAKYYNTKETKVFIKSNTIYNLNNAKSSIVNKHEIIITEGFMDTIRLYSIGYCNVVAIMGTAFTKSHLDRILKFKCKVVLNLDQDNAGQTSTITIGDELVKNGVDVSVIMFSDYKDSDEYIVNKGKEAFDISYNNRISFIDFKLNYLKNNKNMKDTTEISRYINEAVASINELSDDILRELKVKELSKEFDIDESIIKNKLKVSGKKVNEAPVAAKTGRINKYDISEIRILYLMLNNDDIITLFENHLGSLIHDNMSHFAYKIVEFRNDYGYFNYSDFIDYISDDIDLNNVLEYIMKYPNSDEYTEEELNDYIKTIKEYSVKKRIDSLKKEMSETLDINKKIDIAKKIENINKEVLEW